MKTSNLWYIGKGYNTVMYMHNILRKFNFQVLPILPPGKRFNKLIFFSVSMIHTRYGNLYCIGEIYSTECICNAKLGGVGKFLSSEIFGYTVFEYLDIKLTVTHNIMEF
jgi:hypothetical protein